MRSRACPEPDRCAQPAQSSPRPPARRVQPPGARRRRARADRHAARPGLGLRGQEGRCGRGGARHRPDARGRFRRQAARVGAAGLLLARRQAQRRAWHILAEIGWKAVQLDGGYRTYRVTSWRRSRRCRRAFLPRHLRTHRFGKVGCSRAGGDRGADARPRGPRAAPRLAARRPAGDPRRRRRYFDSESLAALDASTPRARCTSSPRARRSAPSRFPTRCSPRCANRPASASTRRSRCAWRC